MPIRTSSARWQGNLTEGSGTIRTGKGGFEGNYSLQVALRGGRGHQPRGADRRRARRLLLDGVLEGAGRRRLHAHLGRDHREGAPRQDRRRHDRHPDRPGHASATCPASTTPSSRRSPRAPRRTARSPACSRPAPRSPSPPASPDLTPIARPDGRRPPGRSRPRPAVRRDPAGAPIGHNGCRAGRDEPRALRGTGRRGARRGARGAARPDEQRGDPGRGRLAAGRAGPARPLRGARADRPRLGLRRACCPTGSPSTATRSCAICDNDDDVVDEVAVTVVHEIAHHFGIDDDRLHELGWG